MTCFLLHLDRISGRKGGNEVKMYEWSEKGEILLSPLFPNNKKLEKNKMIYGIIFDKFMKGRSFCPRNG